MLISVRNMELTYELHKAIKLNFINARNSAVVVRRVSKHFTWHMHSRPYWSSDVRAECALWYKPSTSADRMTRCTANTRNTMYHMILYYNNL